MRYFVLLAILTAAMFLSISVNRCEAEDVWVSYGSSKDIDIYVMDDTIIGDSSDNNKYFKVSVKEVRNDELIRVVDWHFSQYKTDMWRYATSEMDGTHTTAVISKNELFEFCMNKLGWSYRIDDMWYY